MNKDDRIPLRAYNTKELAMAYGVDPKTMGRWIKIIREKIGPKMGRLHPVSHVEKIFAVYGWPRVG